MNSNRKQNEYVTMITNGVSLEQDLKITILINNLPTAILQKVNTILLLNTLILRSGSDLFSLSYVYLYEESVSQYVNN